MSRVLKFEILNRKGKLCINVLCAILFAMIVTLLLNAAEASNKKLVRLTNGEWPPYASQNIEGYGIFTQLVTEAFSSEGYLVEYEFFPWKRAYELAKAGDWDGSVFWQPTKERERIFYFSEPVIKSRKVFFHRKDYSFDWKTLRDLKGIRIGTTRGYSYSPSFRSQAEEHGLTLIDNDSDLMALNLMLKGRINIHPNDIIVGNYLIQNYLDPEDAARITHHPKLLFESQNSVIFSKKLPRSKQLVEVLNRGLERLKQNGRYQEIVSEIGRDKDVLVAFANWPPWKIIRDGKFSGIDVAILDEIGKQIGIRFKYVECPWKRCVEKIRFGDLDMITSFAKTPDRETFVEYLEPPYRTEKVVFYKKKGKPFKVKQYEDLYKYKIGTVNASKYFNPFNEDERLNKEIVALEYQLPHMLASERIDLIAGHEKTMDYLSNLEGFKGRFEKLSYNVLGHSAYLAISKRSNVLNEKDRIEDTLRNLVETNEIDAIIDTYLDNISPSEKQ